MAVDTAVREQVIAEYDQLEAELDSALHAARIERYGTNDFMRWCLSYGQHAMVHQDGPLAGRFIAPGAPQFTLTAGLASVMEPNFPFPRFCGELFRDSAKSTYGTTFFTLWGISERGKRNVLILCATKDEAKDRIRNIVEELETNARLKADYPDLEPARDVKGQTKAYTDYQIILKNGARIKAYEFGRGKLRGTNWQNQRPDLVICDDPEPDDFEYSETYRERARHWLQASLLRAVTRWCPIVWLGTPVGGNALILWARTPTAEGDPPGLGWRGPFVPIAVELDGKGHAIAWQPDPPPMPFTPTPTTELEAIASERGLDAALAIEEQERAEAERWWRPAWPERFDALNVARMLNEGDPHEAQQELMLRPVRREQSPFDIAWFDEHQFKPELLKRPQRGVFTYDNLRLTEVRAWIDSAGSTEPTADNTAIAIGAQHPPTGKLLLIKLFYGRFELPAQLDLLHEMQEYYGCRLIGGQKSHFETAISQFNKRFSSLPMELQAISNAAGAKDRRLRLLTVPLKSAAILFNPADTEQRSLRREMKHYPAKHDDALDALERLYDSFFTTPGAGGDPNAARALQPSSDVRRIEEGW